MRLEQLRVESFGHFRGLELRLSPGLNLVYGPNGAGKSTLLGFIRGILFGFEKRSDPLRYEPPTGTLGGELLLSTEAGPLWVRRVAGRRQEGDLAIRLPSGEPLPSQRLQDALHGVSQKLFYEVFAFGLSELQQFERMADEGTVSEALFAAATQGAQRLPGARELLKRRADELFAPRGSKPRLNLALAQLGRARARAEAAGNRPLDYGEKKVRLEALGAELAQAEQEEVGVVRALAGLERLKEALPGLMRLRALEEAVAGAPPGWERFPAQGVARYDEASARVERAGAELAVLARAKEAVSLELSALAPPRDTRGPEAALELWNASRELRRSLPGRVAALKERQRQVATALGELLPGLETRGLAALEVGPSARGRLLQMKEEYAALARTLGEQRSAAQALSPERERLEARVAELGGPAPEALAERLEALGGAERALRRIEAALGEESGLAQRIDLLRSRFQELDAPSEPPPRPLLSPAEASVAGALLALALGLALVLLGGPALRVAMLGWALVAGLAAYAYRKLAGAAASAQAAYALRRREQQLERRRIEEALSSARDEREQLGRGRVEAAHQAGLGDDLSAEARARAWTALGEARSDAERAAQRAAERRQLAGDLEALVRRQDQLSRAASTTEAELAAKAASLSAWASERGLPAELHPEALWALASELSTLRAQALELRGDEEAVQVESAACAAADERLLVAARALGVAAGDPEVAAAELLASVRQARDAHVDRERLSAREEQLRAQTALWEQALADASGARARLLEAAGVEGEESFRRREAEAARAAVLAGEARDLRLALLAGLKMPIEQAWSELAAVDGEPGLLERAQGRALELDKLRERRQACVDERARLRQLVEAWEHDGELAAARAEEETLSLRAVELARACAVDRLALELLQRAQERYERERQPEVVRRASLLFQGLTGGLYPRVYIAAEGGRQLRVVDGRGESWPAEKLSRGTREQLFLAFRLALVEELAAVRGPLPLILDDVLVNFDAERTRSALRLLTHLSRRHQILALTCHPAAREAFAQAGAQVHELPGQAEELRASA